MNNKYSLFMFNSYHLMTNFILLYPQLYSLMPLTSKFILFFFLPLGTLLDLVNTRSWRNFRRGRVSVSSVFFLLLHCSCLQVASLPAGSFFAVSCTRPSSAHRLANFTGIPVGSLLQQSPLIHPQFHFLHIQLFVVNHHLKILNVKFQK